MAFDSFELMHFCKHPLTILELMQGSVHTYTSMQSQARDVLKIVHDDCALRGINVCPA